MDLSTLKEVVSLWSSISGDDLDEYKNLELELHQKLLNFFHVGDFYYFVFNFTLVDFELVSESVKRVLGFEKEVFGVQLCISRVHPDDQAYFINFENEALKFYYNLPVEKRMKYKISMDYRMQKTDGSYIRILHQVIAIQQYEDGTFFRTLGVHTDITHLKPTGKPLLSFIGVDGEPSYINVIPGEQVMPVEEMLSRREKEILILLIDGKKTSEIAELLFIAARTVETHRKNMMEKTNSKTTGQLIATAIKKGWL